MGQVAAVGQIHADDRVAGLEQRHIGGEVGLRAGMRLHIGIFCAKELLGAVDGDLLDDVGIFTAAVVAFAGVALGVFIGQNAAHGRDDGGRGDIFGRDQLDVLLLAMVFILHLGGDLRVELGEVLHG